MRTLGAIVAAAACAAAAPAGAGAMVMGPGTGPTISVGFAAFAPQRTEVLMGETVTWSNDSARKHTVTADDGSFDSGEVPVSGSYARALPAPGVVAYHCRLHAGMAGELDVRAVLLDPRPQPAAPGRPFPLPGRAALPAGASVRVEGDDGTGFAPAATATVGSDGTFTASVTPRTTTTYRAIAPDGAASPDLTLLVLDRTVTARATRTGVLTLVTPAPPGAHVVLQLRLRDHFGWWPVQRARLDARGRARFALHVHRTQRARVALVLPDGATILALSPTLAVRQ